MTELVQRPEIIKSACYAASTGTGPDVYTTVAGKRYKIVDCRDYWRGGIQVRISYDRWLINPKHVYLDTPEKKGKTS